MTRSRVLAATALAFVISVHPAIAQELSGYRDYVLETSVAAVVKTSGVREADVKTLHTRPVKVQQVEWRAPYVWSGSVGADPVHNIVFSFLDERLYEIVVSYDRDRMAGMTSADVVESVSATYGAPTPVAARASRGAPTPSNPFEPIVVARWENEASLLTLLRLTDVPRFQLILVSKALNTQARTAISDSTRLDSIEAPQRNLDLRKQEAAAALLKDEAARAANKAAFRP